VVIICTPPRFAWSVIMIRALYHRLRDHQRLATLLVVFGLVVGCYAPPPPYYPPPPSQKTTTTTTTTTTKAAPAPVAPPESSPVADSNGKFKVEEIDQMLAPIALYPDSLLAQVLMASTYPAQVREAAEWSKANPNQKGDDAIRAVQDKPWDPSVQSLVAFPAALDLMYAKPDWVQNLGDCFLAQSEDVMSSVQRLRAAAKKEGNLKSNEYQKVVEQEKTIVIEPSQPDVAYVPAYNPTVVYGSWWYPYYPPFYYPPPAYYYPGYAFGAGIAWGIGIAVVGGLWGNCNWGGGNVNINVNRYNQINHNKINNGNWQHNAGNRGATPYRDSGTRQKYGQGAGQSGLGQNGRNDFRGRDAQRANAAQTMQNRGFSSPSAGNSMARGDGAGGGRTPGGAGSRPSAGNSNLGRTQSNLSAGRGGGNGAFGDVSQPRASNRQSSRGSASRGSMSRGGGGGRRR
jgi:Protein of unknown function (DUF3300)